jgi:hypothetical protein
MAGDPRFGQQNGKGLPMNIGPLNAFPRDRFNNRIGKGQKVLYRNPHDLVWDVVDVQPVLDPRAPTNAVRVVLMATVPIVCPGNQPLMEFLAIGAPPADDAPAEDEKSLITEN